nr:membrane protein insertase YidC [Longirhabdus pacifica]
MSRKLRIILSVILLFSVFLAGCSDIGEIEPKTTEEIKDQGFFFKYFVYPISFSLDWFADNFINSYGISILVLTIIIRFVLLPLNLKQARSTKAMQKIQPDIQKVREKYKNDPRKMQEETMKLFQKHGVNPMGGCLPLLIQMPILFALYYAIMWNVEIREATFLWMQLGEPDPYYILPILAALTTYLQQKVMMSMQPSAMKNNPMQVVFMILPIVIFIMAINFPSALPLYWVYSNIFTIIQTYFIYGRPEKE